MIEKNKCNVWNSMNKILKFCETIFQTLPKLLKTYSNKKFSNLISCKQYKNFSSKIYYEVFLYKLPHQWKWWFHWPSLCLSAHSEGKGGYGFGALHCPWPQIFEPEKGKDRQMKQGDHGRETLEVVRYK